MVDIAVIEVGLGGLNDSTNIIPPPLMAVVTNIALDHTEILGDSKEKILQQKLGIVKAGSKVLIGNSVDRQVTQERCSAIKVDTLISQDYRNPNDFMSEINDLVRLGADLIDNRYHYKQAINNQIMSLSMPCRMQRFVDNDAYPHLKQIVLDVGHNEDAISKVLASIQRDMPADSHKKWTLIFGCKANKDVGSIWARFIEHASIIEEVIVCKIN